MYGFDRQQIPTRVECIDFEFSVEVIVAVRIDEHLEIIVVKNNGIMLVSVAQTCGSLSAAMWHIVPEHFGACAKLRRRPGTLDIDKIFGPGNLLPGVFIRLPSIFKGPCGNKRSLSVLANRPGRGRCQDSQATNPASERTRTSADKG